MNTDNKKDNTHIEPVKATSDDFLKDLEKHYGKMTQVPLTNKDGEKFNYSKETLAKFETKFTALTKTAISHRETKLSNYFGSGYIVSEINAALRKGGENSTRKKVEDAIKVNIHKDGGSNELIDILITNHNEALKFILGKNEINEKNLYTMYRILTKNLGDSYKLIKDYTPYRTKTASIGKDTGLAPELIQERMNELFKFIKSDSDIKIHTKAIISHYIFVNIYPYHDFNGRMGGLLHLWILFNDSSKSFWELIYLSEAIFEYKEIYDQTFLDIVNAKKMNSNIDLTYFSGKMYDIFNKHTKAYIKMRELTGTMNKSPSSYLRMFIVNIICQEKLKWYTINDFKEFYPDYSLGMYGKITKEIQNSNLFDIQISNPIKFKLKK